MDKENTKPKTGKKAKSAPAKPKLSKNALIAIVVGAVVVAVAAVLLLTAGGGDSNYMAPLDLQLEVLNAKTYDDYVNATIKSTNGLLDGALEKYYTASKDSSLSGSEQDSLGDAIYHRENLYGKDYSFYYETEDLEKIEKSELKSTKKQIQELAKVLKTNIDEIKKDKDALGVSDAEAKDLIKAMESIYKILKSPRVTKGYEMTFVVYATSSELSRPEEHDVTTVEILNIDGKWVSLDSLEAIVYGQQFR